MENADTAISFITRTGRLKWLHKPEGFPELSRGKLERMRRAVIDSHDPTRYIILSVVADRWVHYYRVEDAGFGSHISLATLFKHRRAAEAVRKTIFSGKLRRGLRVVKVKKNEIGRAADR